MMIALKAIQASFTYSSNHVFFQTRRITTYTKNPILCLSKSNDSESDSDPEPEGDTRKQDLLAQIAMLQAQKVRLTDYLDERSAYLTQFAEEANAEFDKVGEDALKGLEEASERIMENIESQMQAFKESQELNMQEIEMNEDQLAEFEDQMEKERNEGLFFKNLTEKKPIDTAKAMEEAEKVKEVTKEKVGSKARRNLYLALITVLAVGIADSLVTGSDWRKVAVLGAILVALFSQFIYEQTVLSEEEKTEKNDENK
ncbi:uncharacterized protein LOC105786535 [Gossypium raimondii]|uniref:8-amino-7-oxononanoate synthase n=3 Tax=Gossypium TaxID=3633 RepID=A0A0D2QJH6_GOSRA|nr:uncharacterized protein LOC105786535 [Gossypium raimondii]KJB17026.1 hypothetical protein B456_002G261300 [Gossypium raimondii]MBA0577800.1 hypothetical protein [Gossypium lobatum]MBA0677495.1 hypothetical protein [Gossypium aridum]